MKMKKIFAIMAVAAIFASCGKPCCENEECGVENDSTAVEEVVVDTVAVDSVAVVEAVEVAE